jgi:hypothetical protein
MKKLTNLNGVKTLSRIEQKSINGGIVFVCTPQTDGETCLDAPDGRGICEGGVCYDC